MFGLALPKWLSWLLVIAILVTPVLLVWLMVQMRAVLIGLGLLNPTGGFRSRTELEEAFRAGTITREDYERIKVRLS